MTKSKGDCSCLVGGVTKSLKEAEAGLTWVHSPIAIRYGICLKNVCMYNVVYMGIVSNSNNIRFVLIL